MFPKQCNYLLWLRISKTMHLQWPALTYITPVRRTRKICRKPSKRLFSLCLIMQDSPFRYLTQPLPYHTDSRRDQHWTCGGWGSGHQDASLLPLWWHCQHSLQDGDHLWTYATCLLSCLTTWAPASWYGLASDVLIHNNTNMQRTIEPTFLSLI